jgi:hypothetical protein
MGVYNMVVDIYSKTVWNNGTAPSLSKAQLDHIETGIKNNNTAIISLQSVQAECENYASEALASKIASASSATASASSALSALVSANTAKTEADRAVAVAGVDIATDLVAGLVRGGGNVEVDANGDMNVPVANNLTTTMSGYVLDARQGKVLNDSLTNRIFVYKDINVYTCANGCYLGSVTNKPENENALGILTKISSVDGNTAFAEFIPFWNATATYRITKVTGVWGSWVSV